MLPETIARLCKKPACGRRKKQKNTGSYREPVKRLIVCYVGKSSLSKNSLSHSIKTNSEGVRVWCFAQNTERFLRTYSSVRKTGTATSLNKPEWITVGEASIMPSPRERKNLRMGTSHSHSTLGVKPARAKILSQCSWKPSHGGTIMKTSSFRSRRLTL